VQQVPWLRDLDGIGYEGRCGGRLIRSGPQPAMQDRGGRRSSNWNRRGNLLSTRLRAISKSSRVAQEGCRGDDGQVDEEELRKEEKIRL